MRTDPAELVRLAERAAREAGTLAARIRAEQRVSVRATKSTPTDVVTEGDTAAEARVREVLLGARPDDGVLGEEGGGTAGRSGVRWIVDPVDGTVNYLYGIPAWAVSIAAEVDDEVVAGCVHDPSARQTWTAVRGAGARLDGTPVQCSDAVALDRALVGTGFGYDAARRARQGEVLAAVLPRVRDIRRLGSAALDLCSVSCGRLDAFYERGLNPWDHAAGGLVAQESGARLGGLRGAPAGPDLVVAAAPGIFDALAELLAELGADADSAPADR